MRLSRISFLGALLAAALATSGTAFAAGAPAPAKTTAAQNCFTGVGMSVHMTGLTRADRKSPTPIAISYMHPLTVGSVTANGPAGKTGKIFKRDRIYKINGQRVDSMTIQQAAKLIDTGAPGSTVTLTIRRDGNHIQRDIKITRETICTN